MAKRDGAVVGAIEIICGGLVLMGLTTQLALIPLFGVIILALYTTKISDF